MASQALLNAQKTLEQYRKRDGIKTAVSRLDVAPIPTPAALASPTLPQHIKAYPTLLLAFHNKQLDPVGRVYQLLRAMDASGRNCGWLSVDEAYQLTDKTSPWYVMCKRNLKNLIGQGDGIAWEYDKENGRLWMEGAARIAAKLESDRFTGFPVLLPVGSLLRGIRDYRAAILAAWHASRKENNPVSRFSIRADTGIPESTQRVYDKVTATKAKENYALLKKVNTENAQEAIKEASWRHGRGLFIYTDWIGKVGQKGQKHLAKKKPNSYMPNLAQAKRGRQRKINRQIDRVKIGTRGDGLDVNRTYYQDASAAAKAYNRDPQDDKYYQLASSLKPTAKTKPKLNGVNLWGCLEGVGA